MKQLWKNRMTISFLLLIIGLNACQTSSQNNNWVDEALVKAEQQALLMAKEMKSMPDRLPRSANFEGKLVTSASDWWCSGFFPGVLWYLYENSNSNKELLNYAVGMTNRISKEQYNRTTHDLGFMLYCSYGNALRLTETDTCRSILLNGAASLSSRYDSIVKCIKSWEEWNKYNYPVIIDNMMNLEMLMWAYKESGNIFFRNVAVSHANTTLLNHYRPDNSSFHVVAYDSNGIVQFKGTDQGYSDNSSWARGQAWGLYGYTMMYRETGDRIYLDQAHRIARFILDHPRLPADKVPYWDFDSPKIPNDYRDSSAAAVIASALLELSKYSKGIDKKEYYEVAEQLLRTLSGPEYTAKIGTNAYFILKHGVGNIPQNSEIDSPLSYGDYYYIEALLRYKNYNK